tara:strand:- start:177 stop:515 length:339 start_codon:yes stop_codon:yes gene_type:complete
MKSNKRPIIIIKTTYPNEDLAKEISQRLLEKRYIACAQISGPINSYYHWNDHIESSKEYTVEMKAPLTHYEGIQTIILEHHPYDIPEIYSIKSDSLSNDYQQWVYTSCQTSS